jgi:membrane protease YdiL (CAAX protease family)
MGARSFIRRYPVAFYFLLVFVISWGGVLVAVGSSGMPATPEDAARLFPVALITMLAGPFISGLLLTGIVHGKAGLMTLLSKIGKWKVGVQWYAVAIGLTPVVTGSTLWLLSQTWPGFLPNIVTSGDKVALLISGIGTGLAAGFFEELGWTGFAVRVLRQRRSIVATGLLVGLVWGLWHFLVTFWVSGDSTGSISEDLLVPPLVFYIGVLPAYRVLMVWLYDRTESLLLSMLMHASLTACTTSLVLPPVTGAPLVKYYLILTVVMWVLIANLLPGSWPIFQKGSTKTL